MFGGTGRETRDWLHVEDAARLLLAAGQKIPSGDLIINGATGVGIPTHQILAAIATAFGGVGRVQFSDISRPGDPQHLIADMSEVQTLGWYPRKVLEDELAHYVEWFKAGAL